jgi:hypothetical protein
MPDVCLHVLYLQFWKSPEDLLAPRHIRPWADLLTTAAPVACKTRHLTQKFRTAILKHPPVYDFVLRVLLGAMLGLYGGKPAPFWVRVYLYANFVTYTPTRMQLAQFIDRHKLVTRICLESYILFSMQQTPMHDFLVNTYTWQGVVDNRFKALEVLQDHLVSIVTDEHFLVDRKRWLNAERDLQALNKEMSPLCFRPVTTPFCDDLIKSSLVVWRKNQPSRKDFSLAYNISAAKQVWSVDQFNLLSAETLCTGLKESTIKAYLEARHSFYQEQKMTGAQHLVAGTDKKLTGLFYKDNPEFFKLLAFATLVSNRLAMQWGRIPSEWTRAQIEALSRITDGELHNDAGVYFVCPSPDCSEIRSKPVLYPEGSNKSDAAAGRYQDRVVTDLGTGEHICHNKLHNVKLLRICMIGIVFSTRTNGNMILCVDCGTLTSLTRECMTARGPTCGCSLPTEQKKAATSRPQACDACGLALHAKSKTQNFRVFDADTGEIVDITVCKIHHANWISRFAYLFTKKDAINAIRTNRYARMIHGSPVFYKAKVPKNKL